MQCLVCSRSSGSGLFVLKLLYECFAPVNVVMFLERSGVQMGYAGVGDSWEQCKPPRVAECGDAGDVLDVLPTPIA